MTDLLKQVDRTISARGLLRRRQSVLIAVSGGIDSMVLLRLLHKLSRENAWRLTVAHLNHGLRGRSSNADEQLVLRTAKKLGLTVVSQRIDIKTLARQQKLSIEMAARQARHDFLARTAKRLKIRTIALAHHADDQIELFFLRLFRGSGNEGLAGMKWRSASPSGRGIELIRPLLDQPKATLWAYADENKIPFREDASNASVAFQRNRIRRELLPLLRQKYQPALDRAITRVMEIINVEADFLSQTAEAWLKAKNPQPFQKLHVAVQRRCVQSQLIDLGITPDFDLIEALRVGANCPVMVAPNCAVICDSHGRLSLRKATAAITDQARVEAKLDQRAGELHFGGLKIQWRIATERGVKLPQAAAGRECFDADKVGSTVVLRHWRPGDRFQPIGMMQPVKLQDLFINQKIPREDRHRLVVAATEGGELFWVEKLRISERFKLSDQTIRRLLWVWKRL